MAKNKKAVDESGNWPIYGGGQSRQRYSKSKVRPPLKVKWRHEFTAPLVGTEVTGQGGQVAGLTSTGILTLLDLDGKPQGRITPGKLRKRAYPVQGPQFARGKILIAREGRLQCYDCSSLELCWSVEDQAGRDINSGKKLEMEADFEQGVLGFKDNLVFVGSARGAVRCYKLETGELLDLTMTYAGTLRGVGNAILGAFREDEMARGKTSFLPMTLRPEGHQLGDGDPLLLLAELCSIGANYYIAGLGALTCLKLASNPLVWRSEYGRETSFIGLCADDESIFVQTDHFMSCYNISNGELSWRCEPTRGECGVGQPVVTDQYVIAVINGDEIEVRDKRSGEVVWVSAAFHEELSSLSVIADHVFLRTERSIVCLRGA